MGALTGAPVYQSKREGDMSFAVIQMVSQSDVLANLAQARRLLEEAAMRGAQLAVLPENFAAMGRRDIAAVGRAEALGEGPILPWLKQTARDLKLWIVAGTLPLPPVGQPDAKVNACSLLINADGEQAARYDKLHLFDVDVSDSRGRYRESDDYAPGERVVVADTPVGKLGLTVCYDLRFPELYSELRASGAELISVIRSRVSPVCSTAFRARGTTLKSPSTSHLRKTRSSMAWALSQGLRFTSPRERATCRLQ